MGLSGARAAQAARFFALVLLAGCAADPTPPPLPRLDIDPDRIAVAGLSSGAYMATQAHLAFSDRLRGAALVAGGPAGCAAGSLETALGPCMAGTPAPPDVAALAARVRERARAGELASLGGLAGDRVWVLHGQADHTVHASVSRASAALYEALSADAPGLAVAWDGDRPHGHTFPTLDQGGDCGETVAPFLGRCGFDAAGAAMDALFGPVDEAATRAEGELLAFDQRPYAAPDHDPVLADQGLLYLPPACAAGERCGLLVVFHGCLQNQDAVGEAFARDAGFNRWADRQRVAVLYPQARASYLPLNPKACWDWWGYTGPDYDAREGAQLRWLSSALSALGAPVR